mgnify:FL=1|nr:MAG TPA: hypothetical protein [Crassvirales sp.]
MFKKPQISLEQKYDVPSLENQYRDILDNFDFKTVAMIMSMPCRPVYGNDDYNKIIGYTPWKMWSKQGMKLYNESELRFMASNMLREVMKQVKEGDTLYWSACGPFKVIYRFGILELNFVLETWSWD